MPVAMRNNTQVYASVQQIGISRIGYRTGAVFSMQTPAPLPKRGERPAGLAPIVKIQLPAIGFVYRIHQPAIPGHSIVITREAGVGCLCAHASTEGKA